MPRAGTGQSAIKNKCLLQAIKVKSSWWSGPSRERESPLGNIIKYKARLCAHGGQTKQGVHYNSTYLPVVTWVTICLLLILGLVSGWHTCQVDFVLAFPQAPICTDVFMEVPTNFRVDHDKWVYNNKTPPPCSQPNVLKLERNVYGLANAALTWFRHLKESLESHGFKQSAVDPCMFVKKDMIIITYVDNCIVFGKSKNNINALLQSLKSNFTLTNEGDVGAYLGIQVTREGPNYCMSRPAAIARVIDQLCYWISAPTTPLPTPSYLTIQRRRQEKQHFTTDPPLANSLG